MIILRRADMTDKDIARFWSKVDKSGDCWTWQAATLRSGYGEIRFRGKIVLAHRFAYALAHRFAYALAHGECANNLVIDHKCHNKLCVNPSHLQLVTHQQNSENRSANKGSKSGIRGVGWCADRNKWQVRAKVKGKTYSGGYYDDVHEAEESAIALRNKLMTNNILDGTASTTPEPETGQE